MILQFLKLILDKAILDDYVILFIPGKITERKKCNSDILNLTSQHVQSEINLFFW
jgi:hypothetical protein